MIPEIWLIHCLRKMENDFDSVDSQHDYTVLL